MEDHESVYIYIDNLMFMGTLEFPKDRTPEKIIVEDSKGDQRVYELEE